MLQRSKLPATAIGRSCGFARFSLRRARARRRPGRWGRGRAGHELANPEKIRNGRRQFLGRSVLGSSAVPKIAVRIFCSFRAINEPTKATIGLILGLSTKRDPSSAVNRSQLDKICLLVQLNPETRSIFRINTPTYFSFMSARARLEGEGGDFFRPVA